VEPAEAVSAEAGLFVSVERAEAELFGLGLCQDLASNAATCSEASLTLADSG
jgi:hypothetical protein